MKPQPITVTEAARNFSECINRTRYQEVTFVLMKNGTPVAELTPTREKVCSGLDLAAVLAKTRLTDEEAKAWRNDFEASRKALDEPRNKWQ